MRAAAVLHSGVLMLVLLVGPATPAAAQGGTTWFTWTHPHLDQTINGSTQGNLRLYGWSMRRDFRGPFSLTLNADVSFLWDGSSSLGTVAAEFWSVTAHYRFDRRRTRLSLFGGYGLLLSERMSGDSGSLKARGFLLGADIQFMLGDRWLLNGSAAYGPAWRTTVGFTPGPATTYLDYRLAVSLRLTSNVYGQLGYRGITWSSVPASFLCASPPCSITWRGPYFGLVFRLGPAAPAAAPGGTTWFTWTHPHLDQTINGSTQSNLRLYGWSIRHDFPSPFSLTLNADVSFLWDGPSSLGTVATEFWNGTVHYRFTRPRVRVSLFGGYGTAFSERMDRDPGALRAHGVLLGADAQYELSRRWLLTGSVAFGPAWRTTVGSIPASNSTYLDYRLAMSLRVTPNVYGQVGYRGITWSPVPASFLCASPCSISWRGPYFGLLIRL